MVWQVGENVILSAEEEALGIAYRIDVRFPSRDIEIVTEWQHIDHPEKHWFRGAVSHSRPNKEGEGTIAHIHCEHCGVVVGTLFTR